MVDQIGFVKRVVTTAEAASVPFTVDLTSPAITEPFSAAILFFSRTSTDDSAVAGAHIGIGFIGVDGSQATETLQAAIGPVCEDGVSSNAAGITTRTTAGCIRVLSNSTATLLIVAAYSASIAGGVRLSFTTYNLGAGAPDITISAILFAGLAKAAVGNTTHTESSSHEDVGVSPFFGPDLLVTVASDNTLTSGTENAALALGFAINDEGVSQVSAYTNYDDNSDPTDADGYYRDDVASAAFLGTLRTHQDRILVESFDSTGFNAIAFDTGGLNNPQFNYLALKFSGVVRLACGNFQFTESTGEQMFGTNFGFNPALVLGMAHFLTVPSTITDGPTAAAAAYFTSGVHGSRAVSYSMEEGRDLSAVGPVNSISKTYQGDHAIVCLEHTGTLSVAAEWMPPSTSSGFSFNFTSASLPGTLTLLGIGLGLPISETEQVSDQVAINVADALSETEELLDSVVLYAVGDRGLEDLVEIDDMVVLIAEPLERVTAEPAGWTYG